MFDVQACKSYVESLIQNDEVERALLVLDNVPAHLRANPDPELGKLKADILAALCTTHAYLSSGLDNKVSEETALSNLRYNTRGRLAEAEVKRLNAENQTPHIVDVGPGEYWIPLGLKALNLKFTYWDVAVDQGTQALAHPLLEGYRYVRQSHLKQPNLFLALEIIEHLPSPQDLAIEALRHCGGWPEYVHLSTPNCCFDPGPKDWRKPCGLPHLRAYTGTEFHETASKIFPGYIWQLYADRLLSLRGIRADLASGNNTALIELSE